MVTGLYTAARGMMNILAKQDVIANNLANSHTNAFKLSQLAVETKAGAARNDENELVPSEKQTATQVYTDFSQGPMIGTQSQFDFALQGKGFFTVQGPTGPLYTRNGAFALNSKQQLVTLTGNPVLDDRMRPIEVRDDGLPNHSFQVREDGAVFVDSTPVGRLNIVAFNQPNQLQAEGNSYYTNPDPKTNPPLAPQNTQVAQGFLEGSNVDPISAMVSMIVNTRSYEADEKAVQSINETLGQAVNDVGKVG